MASLFHASDPHLFMLSVACFTAFLSTLLFVVARLYWCSPAFISRKLERQGVKVLPFRPIFGNSRQLLHMREAAKLTDLPSAFHHDILPRILPLYNMISPAFGKMYVYWWGRQPRLVVSNPDDLKEIMSANFKQYRKSEPAARMMHRIFGSGLLAAEGEDWENQRRILAPAFFSEKLKGMVADMSTSAVEMSKSWEKIVEENGGSAEVEVAEELKNVTADIIARTCFGSNYEKGKAVFRKQVLLLKLIFRNVLATSIIPFYRFLPTPTNLQCWKLDRSIEENLREIVETRKELVKQGGASSYGDDLLGLTLAVSEESDHMASQAQLFRSDGMRKKSTHLTVQQVMAECKTFFFAGHETTANLLSWTMMLLAIYPEWQERARDEVMEICGKEAEPKADQLNKLKIVGLILNESLRLYPPVPDLSSRVPAADHQKDLKLGQLSLPKEISFYLPVLAIHRDRDLWGEDADEFKPERFADGVSKACKNPHGFLPFGMGPRTCIGQSFAMMEAKVVVAAILQRFRFRLSPNYKHAPESAITMKPGKGMQIILEML